MAERGRKDVSEPEPIIYLDHSEVREGMLDKLKAAMNRLAALVEEKEPRMIAYRVYFSENGREMTVVHIHPDPASLELHMEVAGPEFPKFADYLRMLSIDIYGRPGNSLLEKLRGKARTLGGGTVVVHRFHAGFARLLVYRISEGRDDALQSMRQGIAP